MQGLRPLASALLLVSLSAMAQTTKEDSDETGSHRTLGGPNGVPGELEQADKIVDAFRIDNRSLHLKGWYGWKKRLREEHGFNFGINGSVLYEHASNVLGNENDAAGGVYRLQGDWMLVGRGTANAGGIIFRLENRSRIGNGIAPASLRGEIGAAASDPGFAYSDNFGTALSVLAWQQGMGNEKSTVGMVAGLLDFSAYLDAMYFQTLSRGFLNRSFILSPTIATTGIGAVGAAARGMVNKNWWIGGGFYDGNARSGDPSISAFEWDELLKHVEVGYTPALSRRGTDRLQLTYWHKDELQATGTSSGSGWLFSYSWEMNDVYIPFLRLGYSDGGAGALAEASVSGGLARRFSHQDWLTLGAGWNKPSKKTYGSGLKDEKVIEMSYLWQFTANTSVLGDLQYVFDPALNPQTSRVWVGAIRLRVAL